MKSLSFIISLGLSLGLQAETLHRRGVNLEKKISLRYSKLKETSDLTTEKAALLAKKRSDLLKDLKRILKDSHNAEQRFELRFRLANLYLEDYRHLVGNGSKSLESLERARSLYKELVSENPTHSRKDELLFQLAQTNLESGKTEEALNTFEYISAHFPTSRFSEEANIQLAESAFDKNDFKKAEIYYNKILQNTTSPLFLFATYKQGWCAYNLSRPEEAIKAFKRVISEDDLATGAGNSLALKREALKDIALAYADLKQFSEATDFFRQQEEDTFRGGLESLGALAINAGESQAAIDIFRTLLSLDNTHLKNPEYSQSLISAFRLKGEPEKTLAELRVALEIYLENSTWKEIFSSDAKRMGIVRSKFEDLTRQMGQELHLQAQKTKSEPLYHAARSIYETYLHYFSLEPEAVRTRFYLAEILYHQKEFQEASTEYYQVFKGSAAASDTKFSSLRYAVLSSYEAINQDRKKAGLPELSSTTHSKISTQSTEPEEVDSYSESEKTFLSLGKELQELYPKKEEAPETLYQLAYLHYIHKDNLKAYQQFWKLIQEYPRHSAFTHSAFLILDILNRKSDYPNMILAAKRFLEKPGITDNSFRNKVGDILRKAELKRIVTLEEQSLFKDAADSYLLYARSYGPQDESLHEKALFNASVCFTKAGRSVDSLDTQELFLRKFPKSALRETILLQLAQSYESLAEFGKAGSYYEKFAKEFPHHKQAKEALRIAGLYYWGSGDLEKAESSFKYFLTIYPKENEEVERDLLALYSENKQTQKHISYLLLARSEKGLPLSKYLDFTLKVIDLQKENSGTVQPLLLEEANGVVSKFQKILSETPKGLRLMAKIKLQQTDQKLKNFESVRLALPQKALETALAKKLRLLKEIETDLHQIASLGGEDGLVAVYKTANLYYEFSRELIEAPVPSDLSAEQVDIYRDELNKQMIQPFKEKALGFVIQCLEKGSEHQLLSKWNVFCHQVASQLNPTRYPAIRTYTLAPFYVSLPPSSASEVLENSFIQSSSFFKEAVKERGLAQIEGGPKTLSLQTLSEERKESLQLNQTFEKSEDKEPEWRDLNLLRLANPSKAVQRIKDSLRKGKQGPAYINLLALAAMESGDYSLAKTGWLSLIVRGLSSPEIINNLGVLESLKGNEEAALTYFSEAHQQNSKDAAINLGLISLRYSNSSAAQNYFESDSDNLLSQIGISVSKIQSNDWEKAKSDLQELRTKHPHNPWIEFSISALGEEPQEWVKNNSQRRSTEASELPELD